MARQGDRPLAVEPLLQPLIDAAHAVRPFPQRAQQLKFAEGGQHGLRFRPLAAQLQVALIALLGRAEHGFVLFGRAEGMKRDIVKRLAQRGLHLRARASVHRPRQAPDAGVTAEAIALLQQAQAVSQRASDSPLARRHRRTGQPGQLLRPRGGIARTRPGADIPQHRPRFYGGQLVAIAEENHPPVGRQRVDKPRHHRQVDHRGFIHHQHVQMQRVAGVIAHPLAAWLGAQQTMQRAGLGGNQRFLRVGQRQFSQRRAQRFGQARRRFPRRCRQANTTAWTVFNLDQRRQKLRHGGGLPGPGTAGDHRDAAGQRHRRGHFLPVGFAGGREQGIQGCRQPGLIHLQHPVGFVEEAGDGQLVAPHPVQIEPVAA